MCGIVGAVARREATPILIEGLRRLEYRGYDSAGLCVENDGALQRVRRVGKVGALVAAVADMRPGGTVGIAHTRWATHGEPSEANAHPHIARQTVAVVHNGIIENHNELKQRQERAGYRFTSATDTEVVAHEIHHYLSDGASLFDAVKHTTAALRGAYALGVISSAHRGEIIAARQGCPLVIGVGNPGDEGGPQGDGGGHECFIASDPLALLPVTRRFIYLEDGDIARLKLDGLYIEDNQSKPAEREVSVSTVKPDAVTKGAYRHFMYKEIHEQPAALAEMLESRVTEDRLLEQCFGPRAAAIFNRAAQARIIACGTSYHAGLVARNWFEGVARVPCRVEVASEFRYRHPVADENTLIIAVSQSGETADTLAAVKGAREMGFGPALGIINAPESSLARECDLTLLTRAGPEIGVASTKAFTTQLSALLFVAVALGRRAGLSRAREAEIVRQLRALPRHCEAVLQLDGVVKKLSPRFATRQHALFLGRGVQYPVAMEGALKMKELSYIHAEAYPAGELKHGPLALVDNEMPVIAVAPKDDLLEKLKSNLQEVRARGGELFVFADADTGLESADGCAVVKLPLKLHQLAPHVAPIIYTIPLQLLAYHVAVIRGTDVDQPRNLAKSVTVE